MHATSSSYPAILALYYLKSACFIKIRSGANIFRMPSVISGSGLYHVHTAMLLYISLWPHGSIMFSLDFALLWMQIKWWTVNSTMQYTELAVCLFPSSFLPPSPPFTDKESPYTRLYCCDVPRCRTFTHCYSSVFCPAECQRDKTANQSSNNSAFTPNWLSAESRGGIRCIGGVISKHLWEKTQWRNIHSQD